MKKGRAAGFEAIFEQWVKEDGGVFCELCSTENWKLYHTPKNPCPKTKQREPRRSECPYCTSDNEAIRDTYYDQTCEGCVKRMGKKS